MLTDTARERPSFLDIEFDSATYPQVSKELDRLSRRDTFAYVVTPNVDHVLLLNPRSPSPSTERFRAAYAAANMRLCDSRILQKLARLHDVTLDVVTGSDLTAHLFRNGNLDGRKVAIVGGDAQMLIELRERFPPIQIVQHQPPMGVLQNPQAAQEIISFVEHERAHYVLLAIGAPQSEIIAHQCAVAGKSIGVGLCVGASIEFLLDRKRRAPRWTQSLGLEWAFRLLSEPNRLWKRYLVTGPRIFVLASRWDKGRSHAKKFL